MNIQRPIVEQFGEVVHRVGQVILPYLKSVEPRIVQLHYEHGHPLEIVQTLTEMDQTHKYEPLKYPLVGLFEDIIEGPPPDPGYNSICQFNFIIANQTEGHLKSADREERNFKPILVPIYEELIRQIKAYPGFVFDIKRRGNKINRKYWGKEGLYGKEGNIFNDRLDCIEVQGLTVTVRNTSHCISNTFSKSFK